MKKLSIILPTLIVVGIGLYFWKQKSAPSSPEVSPAAVTESAPEKSEPSKSTGTVASSHEESAKPEKPKSAAPTCYAYEYRHTDEAKTKDIEEFLDYSNAFPILHTGVNQKSICVRVNQKPVPFQVLKSKKREEIMIGSVVGPESIIRVSYCVGKASCMEACPVSKKRFMDDMMSGALDDDANVADDVKSKAKELRALASQNKDLNDHSIIRTWTTLKTQEWACKK